MLRPLAAITFGLSLATGVGSTEPEKLTFENQTGQTITHLYEECYDMTDCDWDDMLGERVLESGATVRYPVNSPEAGLCGRVYRARLSDRTTIAVEHVDSCRSGTVIFRPAANWAPASKYPRT